MSTDLTTIDAGPARKPLTIKITGKVKAAVEAMVWQGLPRKDAAAAAGISEHGLYKALRKPPVKAFYLSELDVLRTSERARNFHTLCDVRDQTGNQMARVNAVKAIEQLADDNAATSAASRAPGICIVIGDRAIQAASVTHHQRAIDANPLITQGSGSDDQ